MFPAARKGDPVTHDMIVPSGIIGPPISGPCPMQPVLIEGLPAAHVNCTAICTGAVSAGIIHPPPPVPPPIIKGSMTVLIHGMPAARWAPSGDLAACGVFLGDPKLYAARTVFIGDMGGAVSPQAAVFINAAKAGIPFCAICSMADSIKEEAADMLQKFKKFISDGRKNAQAAAEKASEKAKKAPELKDAEFKVESKEDYTDKTAKTSAEIGFKLEQKTYDNQLLYYGNENANVKIGHAESSVGTGYSYDLEKKEHKFTAVEAKGKVSVIEAGAKGKAAKGLLEGEVKGEALSIAGEAVFGATVSKDSAEVKAGVGAEANLIKGEAKGQVNITPKTIYDNTVGSAVSLFSPKSKFASAPKFLDHGVVIGAKGEAGIGAAAKAEAGAGVKKGVAYVEAEVKLGAGPMAGLKLFLGVK
ncbi:MAG: PAAR domain-containing protein [Desulfamplus sp.]|nr:PAAR domain-containing protein [Desulfamplus sp.]